MRGSPQKSQGDTRRMGDTSICSEWCPRALGEDVGVQIGSEEVGTRDVGHVIHSPRFALQQISSSRPSPANSSKSSKTFPRRCLSPPARPSCKQQYQGYAASCKPRPQHLHRPISTPGPNETRRELKHSVSGTPSS